MDKALEMLKTMLTTEQVSILCKKYNLDDLDEVLTFIVESTIAETRNEINTNNQVYYSVNDIDPGFFIDSFNNDDKSNEVATVCEPSEDELESLKKCSANCYVCTLKDECNICRY